MKQINVGVWGLGPHARKNILPAISSCAGLKLVGVHTRDKAVLAETAAAAGCAAWDSADEMLADPRLEAVYVATPIGLHGEHGARVLGAGKHLWCEKPIAAGGAQAAKLVQLSRSAGVSVAEGFMYLYHPQFAALQAVLASGRLGYIHSVTCRFGIPALEDPRSRNNPELGGGAFLDVGSYTTSAAVALFPHDLPAVLFSEIRTVPGARGDSAGRAVLRYQGGATVNLEWATDVAYRNEIELWGTRGSVFVDRIFSKRADFVPQFRFRDVRGEPSVEAAGAGNHFESMFAAFRDLADDDEAAERERGRITDRAQLMDAIRAHSTLQE